VGIRAKGEQLATADLAIELREQIALETVLAKLLLPPTASDIEALAQQVFTSAGEHGCSQLDR
jgi:hypothetical protein